MAKIKMTVKNLDEARRVKCFGISGVTTAASGFKTSNTPPTEEYVPFERAGGRHEHAWIHAEFDTPEAIDGVDYYLNIECGLRVWDATGPQSLVFLNGKVAFGFDVHHRDTLLEPATHYDMYNYMYNCDHGGFGLSHSVYKVYTRVEKLYYDMVVPFEAVRDVYSEYSSEYNVTLRVLEEAANLIDFRKIHSEEFLASVERAIDYLETEYYGKLCSPEGKPRVNCLGHTHIDVEWCWDRFVTMEKIQRSAASVVDLMRSYPDYKFMLSQPELYLYLKDGSPETYEAVKQLVAEGRWEPEGALLVECDCNLVSGESLVRQVVMGKRFFRNEFGKDSRVLFLPDVFGYSAALPQILKKSGVDYFMTSKIGWNDTNTMPHDNFIWQGIDGTEIFSSFIQGQKYTKKEPARTTTYVGNNDSNFIYGTWHRQSDKEYVSTAINTYGWGDGGGGPTKDMLEKFTRLKRGLPGMPVAVTEFLYDYMVDIEAEFLANAKKLGKMPKWVGELYLEFHRGTYTTMADNKRDNRKMEFALEKCESLAMIDLIDGGEYDSALFYNAWHKVLHNQFHDILPGSSIKKVYENTKADYAELLELAKSIVDEKISAIAKRLDTKGGILVYNPLGFDRRGAIKVDGATYITDEAIPSFGYKVITPVAHTVKAKAESGKLENEFFAVSFNEQGFMTSFFDKKNSREVLSGIGSEIRFHEDYPEVYDAWEIDKNYFTKCYIPGKADEKIVRDGDRVGLRYTRKYMNSTISQTFWADDVTERLDIETYVDWHEAHQLMKLAFPFDIHTANATFETQYGHLSRPTHRNTSWDEAKFEVCAHKWLDVSEHGYGVALLNDSKYGYSVEGSTVTVTCLRAPKNPNPDADIGEHRFTVSILPHKDTLAEGNVIREAYALNQPLEYRTVGASKGTLPEEYSLAATTGNDVLIECIKKAEDNNDMIVRLYETFGGRADTTLTVSSDWTKAEITNLMEETVEALDIKDGKVALSFTPFEIKTVKLSK